MQEQDLIDANEQLEELADEVIRLRAVADAAGTCLDFYDNVLRNDKDFPQEAAMFDDLRAALAALEGGA